MASAIEALVAVLIGLAAMGFFIWTMIHGGGAEAPLKALGALVAFLLVWGYAITRSS